jgi:hypothetical protein
MSKASVQSKDHKPAAPSEKSHPKDPGNHEHPDATYIKKDDIGLVIAKGLAVMYKV